MSPISKSPLCENDPIKCMVRGLEMRGEGVDKTRSLTCMVFEKVFLWLCNKRVAGESKELKYNQFQMKCREILFKAMYN